MDHPAKQALIELSKKLPEHAKVVDAMAFTSSTERRSEWPEDILLPKFVWGAIYAHCAGIRVEDMKTSSMQFRNDAERLAFLSTWGKTQGIYRFDETIYNELINSPIEGDIPASLLRNLPQWCIYVETPGLMLMSGIPARGTWVMPEYSNDEVVLSFMFDPLSRSEQAKSIASVISIDLDGGTIEESMNKYRDQTIASLGGGGVLDQIGVGKKEIEEITGDVTKIVSQVLSLVLYICTQNDYATKNGRSKPSNPELQKTKRGLRMFTPSTPEMWDVGVRMGTALRKAMAGMGGDGSGHSGASPRPHVRSPHWHGFRIGNIKDEHGNPIPASKREMRVKFLPSIPVNFTAGEDLPAVIRKVR